MHYRNIVTYNLTIDMYITTTFQIFLSRSTLKFAVCMSLLPAWFLLWPGTTHSSPVYSDVMENSDWVISFLLAISSSYNSSPAKKSSLQWLLKLEASLQSLMVYTKEFPTDQGKHSRIIVLEDSVLPISVRSTQCWKTNFSTPLVWEAILFCKKKKT